MSEMIMVLFLSVEFVMKICPFFMLNVLLIEEMLSGKKYEPYTIRRSGFQENLRANINLHFYGPRTSINAVYEISMQAYM